MNETLEGYKNLHLQVDNLKKEIKLWHDRYEEIKKKYDKAIGELSSLSRVIKQ